MKNFKILAISMLLIMVGCKKEADYNIIEHADSINSSKNSTAQFAAQAIKPFTVQTIAGVANTYNYADGVGAQAKFSAPRGIQLMDDGTIYVADYLNSRIRKITPPNIVSTIAIPSEIVNPWGIGIAKDGTINIAWENGRSFITIIEPNGKVVTNAILALDGGYFNTLKMDVNGDFWYSERSTNTYGGVLKKCKIGKEGTIGTDAITFSASGLSDSEAGRKDIYWTFRFAYNGVIYLCAQYIRYRDNSGTGVGDHLYKYTPSGGISRVYKGLPFDFITSIISTRDSKTLYFADRGIIYRLYNGNLRVLVGPRFADGRDGVGSSADVHAYDLALSKDENTIYFTDLRCTVRKLILK